MRDCDAALPRGRSKYGNVRTVVDGIEFASKKEAGRWLALKAEEKAGRIIGLERQPKLVIEVNGHHVCNYFADFTYKVYRGYNVWERIYEDVKGGAATKTALYKLKRKLVAAALGIKITET